jgi:hypothetical protein
MAIHRSARRADAITEHGGKLGFGESENGTEDEGRIGCTSSSSILRPLQEPCPAKPVPGIKPQLAGAEFAWH